MSRSSTKRADKQMENTVAQFCSVTGASTRDAKRYIDKYKRLDIAVDAYYNDPVSSRQSSTSAPSTSKLNQLFDTYKEADEEEITVDGTIRLCGDVGIDPEDVVWLAVAYELKSPRMGEWSRKGWVEGWKSLGVDAIPTMKTALPRLRNRLESDSEYYQKVYNYTFEFARQPGQRSLAIDTARDFWNILLPHGLQGGALAHIPAQHSDDDEDDDMAEDEEGWQDYHTQWWFEFLAEKGGKGVSKDTWQMFLEFVRTIDAKFENYDLEAAWPSTIDDFVEYAKQRLASEHA